MKILFDPLLVLQMKYSVKMIKEKIAEHEIFNIDPMQADSQHAE